MCDVRAGRATRLHGTHSTDTADSSEGTTEGPQRDRGDNSCVRCEGRHLAIMMMPCSTVVL